MSFRPTGESGDPSSQFNANYQSLLLSEALYKTDKAQSNRDEVQTAVQYFDSIYAIYHTDELAMFAARSHYMNGVGHYENDSVVNALKEYLRTLEIMENHFEDNDITGYRAKFMGLTYTRMGEVYYTNNLAEIAVESYKNALRYFERVPYYNLANTYRHIGASYYLDSRQDSALYYYRKAIVMTNGQKSFVHSASLSESAPIYYDLGFIDSAFMIIRKALSLPTVEDSRLAQYYTLGSLYAKTGQYDSAIFYLKQSIERNSFATQTSSADLLISCYNAIGDSTMTAYYTIVYGNCFTKYREYSDIKSELAKIYDTNFGSILRNKYTLMAAHQQRRNIILLSTLLFLLLCFTIVFTMKTEKSRKEVSRKNQELAIIKRKMSASTFMEEPICKMIMNIVNEQQFKSKIDYYYYRDFALGKEHLMELREAVNLHYDSFTIRLRNKYPELTDYDIDYCCLYLLGLKDADISALMQRSYRAVCDRNKKLRSIFRIDYSINTFLREIVFTGFQD